MIKAALWHLMMLLWLAGLAYGVWWIWPSLERLQLTGELAMSLIWLLIGVTAWIFALNLGLRRYWRR
jgi:hypothetical protein